MSYEKFIVDLEVIGMINRYINDVSVDTESLALHVIHEVGPGGEFLSTSHTLEHCRKELWVPEIGLRGVISGDFFQTQWSGILKVKQQMIDGYQKPELPGGILISLRNYLTDQGINFTMLPGCC